MAYTWEQMLADNRKLADRRHRAWRKFIDRQQKLAAIADPRTGGNETLIHNWGNEQARAVIAEGWKRWNKYSERCDKLYRSNYDAARNAS